MYILTIAAVILVDKKAFGAVVDVGMLYSNSFGGVGQAPLITDSNKNDPTSALAIMEFARLVAYSGCSAIPYMYGLRGTLVNGSLQTAGYVNDTLAAGTNQSQVGRILAYAAATAQPDTLTADIESVFNVIFGYYANLGRNGCAIISFYSLSIFDDFPLGNMRLLFFEAAAASLLPSSAEEIQSWIDFIRFSSRLATRDVSVTPSAKVASWWVNNEHMILFRSIPCPLDIFPALITGENRNSSDLLTTNLLRIANNAAFVLSDTSATVLLGPYVPYSYPLESEFNWVLSEIALLTDSAVSIVAAIMSMPSCCATNELKTALENALPGLSSSKIANLAYMLQLIDQTLASPPDQLSATNAQSAMFWLFSSEIYPSVPDLLTHLR